MTEPRLNMEKLRGVFASAEHSSTSPMKGLYGGSGVSPPDMLEAALAYAKERIAVFPLARGTKIPVKGSHSFKDATTDPGKIREWWTKTPNANIGAAVGTASGIVAVDVDGEKGRATELKVIGSNYPTGAWTSRTGREDGGQHHFFKCPEGGVPSYKGDGLEVKSDKTLVVLPPSLHPSGRRYQWAEGSFPGKDALPELPEAYRAYAVSGASPRTGAQGIPLDLPQYDTGTCDPAILEEIKAGVSFEEAIGGDARLEATEENIRLVCSAINALPPETAREPWMRLVFACYEAIDNEAARARIKVACREWSAKAANYTDGGFDNVWGSAETSQRTDDQKAKGGTLFYHAKEAGWDEAAARDRIGKELATEGLKVVKAKVEAAEAAGVIEPGTAGLRDLATPFVATVEVGPLGDEVTLVSFEDIEEAPVAWLWRHWLMLAALNVLSGVAKVGKSTIAYSLAATISAGGLFPDGTRATPGNVLIWSGEDAAATVIKPRLRAAGADMSRIKFIANTLTRDKRGNLVKRAFNPSTDMAGLARAVGQFKPVLVIIDPIVSSIGKADSHKSGEVRIALQPVVDFAMETGCAVLGIHHFSKRASTEDPRNRMSGTHAFGDIGRVNLAAAKVVRDAERRAGVLTRISSNNGPDGGGFAYNLAQKEVKPGIEGQYIDWGDKLVGNAWDIISKAEEHEDNNQDRAVEAAKTFLLNVLSAGMVLSVEIRKQSQEADLKWHTMRRAKDALGVKPVKDKFDGRWYWKLPDDWADEGEEYTARESGTTDEGSSIKDGGFTDSDVDELGEKVARIVAERAAERAVKRKRGQHNDHRGFGAQTD